MTVQKSNHEVVALQKLAELNLQISELAKCRSVDEFIGWFDSKYAIENESFEKLRFHTVEAKDNYYKDCIEPWKICADIYRKSNKKIEEKSKQ